MIDITPLILTYNEAPNLARTLDALTWANRIVVMDSGSTDDTLDIAARYPNVTVCQRAFDTHRDQWNAALDTASTKWVLTLDADYVVSPELVQEIVALPEGAVASGYRARFSYCVGGRPLRGTLYPPRTVLFRRDRARYVQDGHTQVLKIEGSVKDLGSLIYHDDRKPRERWLANQSKYARQEAEKLACTPTDLLGRIDRLRRKGLAPLLTPLYCLLYKRLLLDGRAGLLYTYERTYAEVLLALQLLDHRIATPRE